MRTNAEVEEMKTLGEAIKIARKQAGLTQKELGELLGITGVTMGQWETGRRQPRVESLRKIADVLNVDFCFYI